MHSLYRSTQTGSANVVTHSSQLSTSVPESVEEVEPVDDDVVLLVVEPVDDDVVLPVVEDELVDQDVVLLVVDDTRACASGPDSLHAPSSEGSVSGGAPRHPSAANAPGRTKTRSPLPARHVDRMFVMTGQLIASRARMDHARAGNGQLPRFETRGVSEPTRERDAYGGRGRVQRPFGKRMLVWISCWGTASRTAFMDFR